MLYRIKLVIVLNICFVFVSSAQDSISIKPKNQISIQSGYSKQIVKDDMISPLTYSGRCIPIALEYGYFGNKSRHFVLLSYQNPALTSSITNTTNYLTHTATNQVVVLEYAYLRKVNNLKRFDIDFYLGGKFLSIFNYRDYYYLVDKNAVSLDQHNSLGLDALFEKRFGRRNDSYLAFNLSIPFISYSILNNRYNANVSAEFDKLDLDKNIYWQIFKDGSLVTFNKLFEFQTRIIYAKFLNKHVGFKVQYKLHYYAFDQYQNLLKVKYLNTQLLFGLILRL